MKAKTYLCCTLTGLAFLISSCDNTDQQPLPPGIDFRSELGGDATGYERACAPRSFNFPQDHTAHPGFRNEWWYVTGNVQTEDSENLGFQATFFRIANKLSLIHI